MAERRRKPEREDLYDLAEYRQLLATLAWNVRRLRGDLGLTQQRVAERCDLALALYVAIEAARQNVTAITMAKLCRGLAVQPADLFAPRGAIEIPTKAGLRVKVPGRRTSEPTRRRSGPRSRSR